MFNVIFINISVLLIIYTCFPLISLWSIFSIIELTIILIFSGKCAVTNLVSLFYCHLICDSMLSFWMEANLCRFFYRLFIHVCVCLFQERTCISNVVCRGLVCVMWMREIDVCSICWYWWNCWPSLF
jgi:hypothetical protein